MESSPVFVVGCPRSGTTLLSVLLDRHSALSIPPETAFYDEVAPSLAGADQGKLETTLRSWKRLDEIGLTPDDVESDCGPQPTRASLLATILRLYARGRGKLRFGEKTPQHLPHVPQIMSDFPEAQVICMMRDGRDAALSLAAMPWWAGGLDAAVVMWLRAEAQCASFEAAFPDRFVTVRFEDLVAAPEAALGVAMAFLGLAFEPSQLDPAIPSGVVLGRSRAWKGEALRALDPRAVGRRQRRADPAALATLERALGPALRRRGYGLDAPLRL